MKKLTILLAFIFTFTFSGAVFAETSSDSDKNYKVTESHKRIKDKNELIKRAIKQRPKDDKSKTFNSKQLLEKRDYEDGTVEEDYVSSSVALMDENQQQIDASTITGVTAAGYTYQDGVFEGSNGIRTVAFVQNLYVTARFTEPYRADTVFRVNQVETIIVNQDSTYWATKIEHGYHIVNYPTTILKTAIVDNPSVDVSYYVDSTHSGFYQYIGGVADGIWSSYTVTINSGASVSGKVSIAKAN